MAILVPNQGDVTLGSSQIQPADTYVRQTPQDVSSGFQSLSKALGIYEQNADEMKYKNDLANKEVYTQQLREALNGRKPTDDDVNNVLSGVHPLVRARLSEDLGYLDAISKGSEYFKDIPLTLAPEQATATFDGILAKASTDADGGNLSYKAGYLKAMNEMVASRAKSDNEARTKEIKDVTIQAAGRQSYNSLGDAYDSFKKTGAVPIGNVDTSLSQSFGGKPMDKVEGFVVHHTGGRGTVDGVVNTLKERGLSVQYVIDREGKIWQIMPDGTKASHTKPGAEFAGSKAPWLANGNSLGVEIIANDDSDVTPAQVEAARKLISGAGKKYGFGPDKVFGHGEVNPGHKQDTEGMTVVNMIRNGGFATDQGEVQVASNSDVGISGKPLNPFQQMLRDRFVAIDNEYQRTSNVENGVLRDTFATSVMQLAVDKLDESVLDSIPDRILTPDLRDKFRKVREHIQSEADQARSRVLKQRDDLRKEMTRSAEQKLNEKIAKGETTLSGAELTEYNNIDPDLVKGFTERAKAVQLGLINPKTDADNLEKFYRAVDNAAAKGYDVTEVPFDNIMDPGNRDLAFKYAEKMRVEGGERYNKFYTDNWDRTLTSTYGYMFGGAVPVKSPLMEEVNWTFRQELNQQIAQFVQKNNRLPSDDERYVIFKDARKLTLEEWPVEKVIAGTDVGPGKIPPTPPKEATQPNTPKGRLAVQPDGTKKWIPE